MTKRNAVAFEISGDDDPRWKDAGAVFFNEDRTHMTFACPCDCGAIGAISIGPGKWTLSETPKLNATPSIGFSSNGNGSYHWHGYLRDGVFEEC